MPRRRTVCVAMSGGVDSAVVAGMLVRRGHDVVGVTMQIWQESQRDPRHSGCCSLGAVEDARRSARMLGIPHYVVDFKDAFKEAVIDEFIEEYGRGRTPNPCVTCNRKVKFDALLAKSRELGCDVLATGHYARIRRIQGRQRLMRARGAAKDQSYVLYAMTQAQLESVWFPLGEVPDKTETRRMARELGLPVADKPDSQEICFVSEVGGYREFLRRAKPEMFEEGELVGVGGQVIGRHGGVADFTIGQRRGLGIAAGRPLYVIGIDPVTRRVTLGDEGDLGQREVSVTDVAWSAFPPEAMPMRVKAKIRHMMEPRDAWLFAGSSHAGTDAASANAARLVFDRPVNAVTPGQIAVAYRGMTVVAGGTIAQSHPCPR
ncbi:MAG: tRNA 2-thiouridine(34) synthase MnmA [Fimbriimonadaceae bacterium]|nr:tRNA 2-thiouridine(34) synthase MnmA [Fimbriimonadaceae bacterium]QYK57083.1 MAG: tRNA 2-thiouridine(34) synthase MnmA [Fimbriimonadaceae bacterium]